MPITPHVEKHFTAGLFVRDVVIGIADGLTVPFALAAGLSGAVTSTRLIVIGGLAEILRPRAMPSTLLTRSCARSGRSSRSLKRRRPR